MEKYLKAEHCSIDSYLHMFTVPSLSSFMVWMELWTLGKVYGIHFVSVQGKRTHVSVPRKHQNWLCPLYLWASASTQTLKGCGHLCTLWGWEELKCHAVLWKKFKAGDGMAIQIPVYYIFLFNMLCVTRCTLLDSKENGEDEIMWCIIVFWHNPKIPSDQFSVLKYEQPRTSSVILLWAYFKWEICLTELFNDRKSPFHSFVSALSCLMY